MRKRINGVVAALIVAMAMSGCKYEIATKDEVQDVTKQVASLKQDVAQLNARIAAVELAKRQADQQEAAKAAEANSRNGRLSDEQQISVQNAIAQCLRVVRSTKSKDESEAVFYSQFDAFYNPNSGRVENNNRFVGGLPAVYAFNKCMAANGWPLR